MEHINNAFSQSSLMIPIPCEGLNYLQCLILLIKDRNCKKPGHQTTTICRRTSRNTNITKKSSIHCLTVHLHPCGAFLLLQGQLKLLSSGVPECALLCHYSWMLRCDWLVSLIRNTQGFRLKCAGSLRTNYLGNIFFANTIYQKNIFLGK
jgi:hypothetical protein